MTSMVGYRFAPCTRPRGIVSALECIEKAISFISFKASLGVFGQDEQAQAQSYAQDLNH
jgi:hypothetical protein